MLALDLAIVGFGAVVVPVAILRFGTPPLKVSAGAALGGAMLAAVSLLGYALQGDDIVQLLRFERTAGFGRSFVAGLALSAGFVVLLVISALKRLFSKASKRRS